MSALFLSIIIPTFRNNQEIYKCLDSILKHQTPDYEIIVIDDASRDGSFAKIKERYKDYNKLIFIENEKNLKFAGTVNKAINNAQGEWLLIVNNDVYLRENTISTFKDFVLNNPQYGIVAPLVLNYDGSVQYPPIKSEYVNTFHLVRFVSLESDKIRNSFCEIIITSGCCFFIRRKEWLNVGGFDISYVMYWEEVDLFKRLNRIGVRAIFNPQIICYHKQHATIDFWRGWYMVRNRFLLLFEHYPLSIALCSSGYFLVCTLWQRLFLEILRRIKKPFSKTVRM